MTQEAGTNGFAGRSVKLHDAIASFFQRDLLELFLPWTSRNRRGEIFATWKVLEERSDGEGAFLRVRGVPADVKRLRERFGRE